MRVWLLALALLLGGCASAPAPEPALEAPPEPADNNVTLAPGLIGNATEPGLLDLELPTFKVNGNVFIGFEGPETLALILDAPQGFNLNGGSDAPVMVAPLADTRVDDCEASSARLMGAAGMRVDSGVTNHEAGEYLVVSFGGSGSLYISGQTSNDGDRVANWLIVDGYVSINSTTQSLQAPGLDAALDSAMPAEQTGQGLVFAAASADEDVLSPGYYTKAGAYSADIALDDCATESVGGTAVLPMGSITAVAAVQQASLNATFHYERAYDDGDFVFATHVVTWSRTS